MLDTGLAADCTDLVVGSWERRRAHFNALLHQIRPAMAGRARHLCVPGGSPADGDGTSGRFRAARRAAACSYRARAGGVGAHRPPVEVIDRETSTADVGLGYADVIIAGGAGCDASSWHLVEELAETFGGRVAASRRGRSGPCATGTAGRPDRHDCTSSCTSPAVSPERSSMPWACAPPTVLASTGSHAFHLPPGPLRDRRRRARRVAATDRGIAPLASWSSSLAFEPTEHSQGGATEFEAGPRR